MNKISVFGSTGFIGSNWMKLYEDISYPEERNSLIPKYNNVLYMRGTTSNYGIFEDVSKDVRDNLLLFTETIKNLKQDNTFLLCSSWFCYGKNNKSRLSFYEQCEYDGCNPKGFYSISKRTQEQLLESYCLTFNISYKIVRLSNIIGGDNNASKQKNAVEHLISKLKNNEPIEIYKGKNYRNYLDVFDCCKAIKLVMDKGKNNEIYNIGAKDSVMLLDIIMHCKKKLDSKSDIKIIDAPNFHKIVQVENFWMNTSKLQDLGFKQEHSLEDTLNNLCA